MAVELHRIEIDSKPVTEALARLRRVMADPRPVMEDMAATLEERISGRFETHSDPFGSPWKAKKSGAPSVLQDTMNLIGSLGWEADASGLVVGFGADYAIYHEFGTRKMPRRGMIFADPQAGTLNPADEQTLLDILEKAINGAMK